MLMQRKLLSRIPAVAASRYFASSGPVTRIIRFEGHDGQVHLGEEPASPGAPANILSGDPCTGVKRTGEQGAVKRLLAPIVPTDIYCVGLNYMKHYEESAKKRGIPLPPKPPVWLKPSSTLAHPEQDVWMPEIENGGDLDWEAELTIVIGKACRNVKKEDALKYVLGYTMGNDVTLRYWQKNAGAAQWTKGKGFDTFAPLGPVIVTTEEIPDPQVLRLQTRVNGETMQDFNTDDMIFNCAEIIEWFSHNTTLLPGSVIMTGTGQGVGTGRSPPVFMKVGDVVEVEGEGIGILRNRIVAPPAVDEATALVQQASRGV